MSIDVLEGKIYAYNLKRTLQFFKLIMLKAYVIREIMYGNLIKKLYSVNCADNIVRIKFK